MFNSGDMKDQEDMYTWHQDTLGYSLMIAFVIVSIDFNFSFTQITLHHLHHKLDLLFGTLKSSLLLITKLLDAPGTCKGVRWNANQGIPNSQTC